jgi:hypothetical protein
MNERIQELYNKVVGDDKLNFDSHLAEKFAELIVADVLNEVLQAMDEGADVYYTVEEIFRVEV